MRLCSPAWIVLLALVACGGSAPPPSAGPNDSRPRPMRAAESGELRREATGKDNDGVSDEPAAPAAAPGMLASPAPPPPPPPPGQPQPAAAQAATTEQPARDPSMIIYTARITMAVYQVDTGISAVEKIAADMGGFLAKKGDREITIRVPRARFQPALAAVDKIGDVLHRDVQAQDVTDEYTDLEIRIKNARAMQTRLKALLEKANVKEALDIEKELNRVTQDLELMEGKLKLLKDKIAYSTITVAFEPRGSTLQTSRVRLPFPWLTQLGLPQLLQLDEAK